MENANIRVGSKVRFNVGRGQFTGKVTKLEDGKATVQRDDDASKVVTRSPTALTRI